MKAKGSASLYEVLKNASRPPGEAAGPATAATAPAAFDGAAPSLQDRLAAYKAKTLAAANDGLPAAVAEATPPPSPAPVAFQFPSVHAPASAPTLVPAPEPAPDPGERVVRLTYNTAAFAGLVIVGLLFVAYALGVQSGRRRGAETALEAPRAPVESVLPHPLPPPPPAREHSIRLMEWKYGTAKERLNAGAAADDLKKALDRGGFKGAEKAVIQRGSEVRLALYIDRVGDTGAESARARLAALQRFRLGTQVPFAQAAFEEIPK